MPTTFRPGETLFERTCGTFHSFVVFVELRRPGSFLSSTVSFNELSHVALREQHPIRSRPQFSQKLLNQPRFYSPGFLRMHEIPHDRIQPGVRVNAKDHRWRLTNFRLIDGGLRPDLANAD